MDVEGWSGSALGVTDDGRGVTGGVSRGDVSICTNVAFRGARSGVDRGVPVCVGGSEDSKGEYGGVFTRSLRKGLSISAEAIRVWLHGTLLSEEGLASGSPGSSSPVVSAVRESDGVLVASGVAGPGLTSGGASEGFSLGGAMPVRVTSTGAG